MNIGEKGFTLIELLVAISIIGILSSIGISAYLNYSRNQLVVQNTRKVVSALRYAQSLATNNQKPTSCGVQTLDSFTFKFNHSTKSYTIEVNCSSDILKSDSLSTNLTTSGFTSVKFKILKQGISFTPVTNPITRTLVFTAFGRTKTITVGDGGDITFNE